MDSRNIYIGEYMESWHALKKMQEDFDKLMHEIENNYAKFLDALEKAEILSSLIEAVILEMEKGSESDYKQRMDFIGKMHRFLK